MKTCQKLWTQAFLDGDNYLCEENPREYKFVIGLGFNEWRKHDPLGLTLPIEIHETLKHRN